MPLLIGLSFIVLAIIPLKLGKRIYAPYVLVSGIWGGFLILYCIIKPDYFPLGQRFFYSIMLWVSSFYIGSVLFEYLTLRSTKDYSPNKTIMKIYFIVTPIFAIVLSYMSIKMALNSSNIFLYLRMMNTGLDPTIEGVKMGGFSYLSSLILILFLLELALYGTKRKRIIILLAFLNIVFAFISMSKTIIFTTFFSAIIILLQKKSIDYKKLLYYFSALIGVFVIMQYLRSEDGNVGMGFIKSYLFANPVAFEYADMDINRGWGAYVFRIFYAIGKSLGCISDDPIEVIMDYTSVGHLQITNTYTVLYPFYHDFGFIGVFLFGFLMGGIGGFFYKKSSTSVPAKVIYAIFGSTVVFQLFGEVVFTNASMYLQYLFYAYLPFKLRRLSW